MDSGMMEVIQEAIASTMPVPEKTPTSTPAARTIETTPTMEEECASISVAWSFTFGKLTAKARPEPTMKTNASGKISATKATMTTTVSARLNQISFGRSVERSEEHTSELQSRGHLVCRLLLEKKNNHHMISQARNK